jgi:hypothetical protein
MPRYSLSARPDVRLCVVAQMRPSTSAQMETAIGQRPLDALRHQIDRAHLLGDRAQIGFGNADDRGGAALQPVHHGVFTGSNTG